MPSTVRFVLSGPTGALAGPRYIGSHIGTSYKIRLGKALISPGHWGFRSWFRQLRLLHRTTLDLTLKFTVNLRSRIQLFLLSFFFICYCMPRKPRMAPSRLRTSGVPPASLYLGGSQPRTRLDLTGAASAPSPPQLCCSRHCTPVVKCGAPCS